ncbi:hypothetical protein EV182_003246 [Spiromyces aspiralis]|uniref:Uncharacterized protein n=1 Tax=Spiromyces aspiralis TaxID=68401 RepID=A0ACC1HSV2_9FUNG|nr:hypothetical protein EV182_003246 [Spiromyces aspiralis]
MAGATSTTMFAPRISINTSFSSPLQARTYPDSRPRMQSNSSPIDACITHFDTPPADRPSSASMSVSVSPVSPTIDRALPIPRHPAATSSSPSPALLPTTTATGVPASSVASLSSIPAVDDASQSNRKVRKSCLISRSSNCFILYRSDKSRELKRLHPELNQTEISSMVGKLWKQESQEVKAKYRARQQREKQLFDQARAAELSEMLSVSDTPDPDSATPTGSKRRAQASLDAFSPPNTFIQYRIDKQKEILTKNPGLNQTLVSKMCADMWRNEPDDVKEVYRKKYKQEKRAKINELKKLHAQRQRLQQDRLSVTQGSACSQLPPSSPVPTPPATNSARESPVPRAAAVTLSTQEQSTPSQQSTDSSRPFSLGSLHRLSSIINQDNDSDVPSPPPPTRVNSVPNQHRSISQLEIESKQLPPPPSLYSQYPHQQQQQHHHHHQHHHHRSYYCYAEAQNAFSHYSTTVSEPTGRRSSVASYESVTSTPRYPPSPRLHLLLPPQPANHGNHQRAPSTNRQSAASMEVELHRTLPPFRESTASLTKATLPSSTKGNGLLNVSIPELSQLPPGCTINLHLHHHKE